MDKLYIMFRIIYKTATHVLLSFVGSELPRGLGAYVSPYLCIILAGQITRRVAPSVAPSAGCSSIIIILFFRMNIVHLLHCINMAIHTRPNLGATHCQPRTIERGSLTKNP